LDDFQAQEGLPLLICCPAQSLNLPQIDYLRHAEKVAPFPPSFLGIFHYRKQQPFPEFMRVPSWFAGYTSGTYRRTEK
jgi:hypothetical protein